MGVTMEIEKIVGNVIFLSKPSQEKTKTPMIIEYANSIDWNSTGKEGKTYKPTYQDICEYADSVEW